MQTGGGIKNNFYIESMEFSIYSQSGEDGIIDFLIDRLGLDDKEKLLKKHIYPKAFIEFGVQNYTESNTRFLYKKRKWKGLVIDSNINNINYIKKDQIYWIGDLEAKHEFITADNINSIIKEWLINKKIDNVALLSIDIDGVDYFIWDSISCIKPAILIIEYNALLGSVESTSVPYKPDFNRFKEHYSGLYFGASIKALINLGNKKGYTFIGADSSGTNLFFVNCVFNEQIKDIKTYKLEEYCLRHDIRQSRDKKGNLDYKSGKEREHIISKLNFTKH